MAIIMLTIYLGSPVSKPQILPISLEVFLSQKLFKIYFPVNEKNLYNIKIIPHYAATVATVYRAQRSSDDRVVKPVR